MESIVQIFRGGAWLPAGSLVTLGDEACRFEYLTDYVFSDDPLPVSLCLPVAFDAPERRDDDLARPDRRPPSFVYDLVPQGRGRRFLVDQLKRRDADRLVMPLVAHGAFNPVGCLRIDTAVEFFRDLAAKNPDPTARDGFTLDDITSRSERFLEHLSLHAMLAAGTTGVQGVAPKFLLTRNAEGRWFADLALDDALAREHWLVKLPRGRTPEDLAVLRNEAAYLRVAAACGLRVHAEPMHVGDLLFVRRFDRVVDDGGLHRLHQESLASLAGLRGFGGVASQNELVAALRRHVDDPLGETVEFVKRDVLNLALRNTDNHARNTAVQRLPDGTVRLTPLFDFAPMFADPDVVPRSLHWRDAEGRRVDAWAQVVAHLDVPDAEKAVVARELRAFADTVGRLPEVARDQGVEATILERCRAAIDRQAEALAALPDAAPTQRPRG